jgi:hypothetical protein
MLEVACPAFLLDYGRRKSRAGQFDEFSPGLPCFGAGIKEIADVNRCNYILVMLNFLFNAKNGVVLKLREKKQMY